MGVNFEVLLYYQNFIDLKLSKLFSSKFNKCEIHFIVNIYNVVSNLSTTNDPIIYSLKPSVLPN